MAERTEKLDGYTLMYLLKNAAGLSVDELISYENLNYSSPTTVNRYLNKEKHPRFPTSLTIEMVQRTFANIQKTHFPGNPGGFSDTLLRLLETDLASPQAASEFHILYDSKCRELDEQDACQVLISDLYVKCRQGYTVTGADAQTNLQIPAETAAAADCDLLKAAAKQAFPDSLKALDYLEEADTDLSALKIIPEWLPEVTGGREDSMDLPAYLLSQAKNGTLNHSILFSEPGTGKTYSIFAAMNTLLSEDVLFEGRTLIPVWLSSLLLSIRRTGVTEAVADSFFDGDLKAAAEHFQGKGAFHFLLFIDAVNESMNRDELLEEIIRLSYPVNRNLTLFISSNNADECITLRNSDFLQLTLRQLKPDVVEAQLGKESLTAGMKALLLKPFYLDTWLSFRNAGSSDDEYSVIDAYVENCKTNGKIVRPRDAWSWSRLLDEDLPRLCCLCAAKNQIYISPGENKEKEYSILTNEQDVLRLVRIGVLKKYADAVYFEHENYRNYFAAKYLVGKCRELCSQPDAPAELRTALLRECVDQLRKAPANVCAILAPKLYNEGLLHQLLKDFGRICSDRGFFQVLINLFSYATSVLDGLDLSGADLWITDFSVFDKITDCDLRGADLNPETLWLHHARISYTPGNNGRLRDELIFLSGPEGFEVYNWKDDRQLFIRFPGKRLPDAWKAQSDCLLIRFDGSVYRIDKAEILEALHSNTAPGGEDLLLSASHVSTEKLPGGTFSDPAVTVSQKGDEISYRPGRELCLRQKGRSVLRKIADTCHYATFISDELIFADCDGVYVIMTTEGILTWKRMIKPVSPAVVRKETDGAIIKMMLPGVAAPKYFRYSYVTRKLTYISPDELPGEKTAGQSGFADKTGLLGAAVCTSNAFASEKIEITDNEGRTHLICGGAIDFTGTDFRGATIVSRPADEKEKMILSMFGGITD